MAPKKRTRSESQQASTASASTPTPPKNKRKVYTPDPTFTRVTRAAAEKETRRTRSATKAVASSASSSAAAKKKKKKVTTKAAAKKKKNTKDKANASGSSQNDDGAAERKTIVIEHCTGRQSGLFKTKATEVKEGLEKGMAGITVLINPETPRKGCFEVRERDGEVFVSLPDMKKPFQLLKDLNIEKVILDVIEKVES